MKRSILIAILCLFSVFALSAQEIDSDYVYKANKAGDQQFGINLSITPPVLPKQLNLGGSGSLVYKYLLTENLMIGGSASFSFTNTVAKNVFYFVPVTANITYQFITSKLEIPFTLGIGGVVENYVDQKYFGLVIKPEVGVYFRYSPDWSIGLGVSSYVLPQIFFGENKKYNYCAVLLDFSLGVRYHF